MLNIIGNFVVDKKNKRKDIQEKTVGSVGNKMYKQAYLTLLRVKLRQFDPNLLYYAKRHRILMFKTMKKEKIPFCLCCQFKYLFEDRMVELPEDSNSDGRLLMGALPLCGDCLDQCDPYASQCSVDSVNGRDRTLDDIVEWIMDEE